MNKKYLLYLDFVVIFAVFISGLIQPFFGLDSWLNTDTLSFLALLSVFSFLIYMTDNIEFISRLRSLRIGKSGLEFTMDEAIKESQKVIHEEEKEAQPTEIREELNKIRDSPQASYQSFLLLMNKLEEKVKTLAQANNIRYRSLASTIGELANKKVIDSTTVSIFSPFYTLSNIIYHNPDGITKYQFESAYELGERLFSRLTRVYVQDVLQDKVEDFISNSQRSNPNLFYYVGNPKSGREGYVGIYYTVRPEYL